MSFENENIYLWEARTLADYINSSEFECDDPDKNNILLENDDYSFTTDNTSEIPVTPSTNDDNNHEFLFDYQAFQNAKERASLDEPNEVNITWEDMDSIEKETVEKSSTIGSDENYLISDIDIGCKDLIPCVLIDIYDGQIKRCPNYAKPGHNLRPLRQLIGTWEVDETVIDQTNPESMLHTLGVCMSHLSFDQNRLHKKNQKQSRSVDESFIYRRRCLFCYKDKYFFSRGMNCIEHSVNINDRNVQIPCLGFQVCPALNDQNKLVKKISSNQTARYICSECFQKEGGHFYERKGSGSKAFSCQKEHIHDTTNALKLLGRWISNIAESDDNKLKNILLTEISIVIDTVFKKTKQNNIDINASDNEELPSLFAIKVALRLSKINLKKLKVEHSIINLLKEQPKKAGETFGLCIWKSRSEVREKKEKLETPKSLETYRNGFPIILRDFFDGFITSLQKKKYEIVVRKRKQRGLLIEEFDETHSKKISIFIISMILSIAFPGVDIWLTHIMSSLCRKPNLLSSLYTILCTASVVSHTQRHERRLEKTRISKNKPEERLQQGENIWNLCVIDNIDFKERTFAYGNIYDVTRATTHATLRMVFQFRLPVPINQIITESNFIEKKPFKVGLSQFIDNELEDFANKINYLLQIYETDLDVNIVYQELVKDIELGCRVPPPNVIILEPGENPCNNEAVHNACDMYFGDVFPKNGDNQNIDVACDEAIFRRLISYREQKSEIRILLGAWHTSKEMCNTLITIFSGYGIFNLAACIGVRYLDKLEKVVDYQATCRVLELIWLAVGISLSQIMKNKKKTFNKDNIQNENNFIKIWYLYFCWCGYWIGHKIGIRYGNYDMQFENLIAFAPLFPVQVIFSPLMKLWKDLESNM